MGIIRNESRDVMYMSIFRDKLFVASDDTQDPDYKKIEYTVRGGSEKGAKKTKEGVFLDGIEGFITKVDIEDGKFGYQFVVWMKDDRDYKITVGLDSEYSRQLIAKLANESLDLTKQVTLSPYDFEDKNGKRRTGITVKDCNDKKVQSYFVDYNDGVFSYNHGYPEPQSNNMDSDDWKMYGLQTAKFLKTYLTEKLISRVRLNSQKQEVIDNSAAEFFGTPEPQESMADEVNDVPF
jgi:hypothetical protein